ncbi:hypothetical protein EDC04DRAFT_2725931 [Pisolithus marmoratus]|nr:hypothetical protein EDC04DRAFT_2725931 [Pisolithus marmoratus]
MLRFVSQSGGHAFQYGIPDGVVSGHSGRMGAPLARQPSRLVRTLSSTPSSTSHSGSEGAASPIIYSHVCTLRSIISSNYYPTPTSHIRTLARPLGELAACYLASHGYGAEDIKHILQAHRCAHTSEDVVTFLAGQGMPISKARFLLLLVGQRSYRT